MHGASCQRAHAPNAPRPAPRAQILLFAHSPAGGPSGMVQPPRSLDRFTHVRTSIDNEDQAASMRNSFDAFVAKVAHGMSEKSMAEISKYEGSSAMS